METSATEESEKERPVGAENFQNNLPEHLRGKRPKDMYPTEKKEYNNYRRKMSRANESKDHSEARVKKEAETKATKRAKESVTEKSKRKETNTKSSANKRSREDSMERMQRKSTTAKANASKRAQQSEAEKGKMNGKNAKCTANKRAKQSKAEKTKRNETDAKSKANKRAKETSEESQARKNKDKQKRAVQRAKKVPSSQYDARNAQKVLAGQQTVLELKDTKDNIGSMDIVCQYCQAIKWDKEPPSLCCIKGKVKLPVFPDPPEVLTELLTSNSEEGKIFPEEYKTIE